MALTYVGKLFSNFKGLYYDLNASTLSGAIDVIVVRQPDGSYRSSPFHVRFGKLGVIRSSEKIVDISVNNEMCVDIHMKLGASGEAFFVRQHHNIDDEDDECFNALNKTNYFRHHHLASLKNSPFNDHKFSTPSLNLNDTSVESTSEKWQSRANNPLIHSGSRDSLKLGHTLDSSISHANVSSTHSLPSHFNRSDDGDEKVKKASPFHALRYLDIATPHQRNQAKSSSSFKNCKFAVSAEDIPFILNSSHITSYYSDSEVNETFENASNPLSYTTAYEATSDCERDHDKKKVNSKRKLNQELQWSWGKLPKSKIKNEANSDERTSPKFSLETAYIDSGEKNFISQPESAVNDSNFIHTSSEQEQSSSQNNANSKKTVLRSVLGFITKSAHEVEKIHSDSSIQANASHCDNEAIYLDDIKFDELDPEIANLYFPQNFLSTSSSSPLQSVNYPQLPKDDNSPRMTNPITSSNSDTYLHTNSEDDMESGKGTSVPHSPHPFCLESIDLALSLCGGLSHTCGQVSLDSFENARLSFDDYVAKSSTIFTDPNLVVKIEDKFYQWSTALPVLMPMFFFNQKLPQSVIDELINRHSTNIKPSSSSPSSSYSWFSWRKVPQNSLPANDSSPKMERIEEKKESLNETNTHISITDSPSVSSFSPQHEQRQKNYHKSLRLTSQQIEKLNLKPGINEVCYSVTTQFQGTTRCYSHIFLWDCTEKIVISDIDGTITKSDVLGCLFPLLGKDWSQSGVASLYNDIHNNGYKILYLSSRAIGLSYGTRGYLQSIKQDELKLPIGPILLSPTSLYTCFHREVIENKPEEFKIACLRDIKCLFPSTFNPFFAGFGNKVNDAWAYRSMCIPKSRVFTINHKGELRHELSNTFTSSYSKLKADFVDHFFPPISFLGDHDKMCQSMSHESSSSSRKLSHILPLFHEPHEFSSFTYWKMKAEEGNVESEEQC